VTAVYSLDKAVMKLRKEGKEVEVIGQNEASSTIIDRFGIHDKPEEIDKIMGGH
jgi:SulP family sulfate permease